MRYGKLYSVYRIPKNLIDDTLRYVDIESMKKAEIKNNDIGDLNEGKSIISENRTSSVTFIKNNEIMDRWLKVAQKVNKEMGWDYTLNAIEPLQYGEYDISEQYSWHVDQHNKPYKNGAIRKMSFSVFHNDDYTGGGFDLELYGPMNTQDRRCLTFSGSSEHEEGKFIEGSGKSAKIFVNDALFFQSDYWHRVRPVTKGVRKSLVGWVLGPKFK